MKNYIYLFAVILYRFGCIAGMIYAASIGQGWVALGVFLIALMSEYQSGDDKK